VNLKQASIQSAAFRADTAGTVTLVPVLTNSAIQFPVSVFLSQPIARRVNLVSADTPTNAPYVKLPDFLTETGTVGDPKAQVNKLALLSLAAKGLGGLPIGGTAGNIIQGLGNLGGAGAGTNQSTNKVGSLLEGVGALLGGNNAGNTNANASPGTNTPPTTKPANNQQPINNLLNDLLKPKEEPPKKK